MSRTISAERSLVQIVRAHACKVLSLPEEPPHGYHGLPDTDIDLLLRNAGYFVDWGYCDGEHPNCHAEKRQCECESDCDCDPGRKRCDTKIFKLSDQARDLLEEVEKPDTLPCGHQGLHNIRGGGYTCQNENCNAEFSREIAKQLY